MNYKEEILQLLFDLKRAGIDRRKIEKDLNYKEFYIDQAVSKPDNKRFITVLRKYAETHLNKKQTDTVQVTESGNDLLKEMYQDLIRLKAAEKVQGMWIYVKTNKGEKQVSIEVHPKLQAILDRHNKKGFVFPFATAIPDDKRKFLDTVNILVNRDLKIVAAAAGIHKNLTFHLSHHTLSMHLKQAGVSTDVIKDVLGHSTVAITERYLKALDDTALDREMDKVYK